MSFTIATDIITQASTDTDLSGLLTNAGVAARVTRTFEGLVAVYTFDRGVTLTINGTLTIDPEVNKMVGDANEIIKVTSTGRLNLGRRLEDQNRFTSGMAIQNNRAQVAWFGGDGTRQSILIENAGELVAAGASVRTMGGLGLATGSTAWIRSLTWYPQDLTQGQINPITGSLVTATDLNEVGISFGVMIANRGFIHRLYATDIRVEELNLFGGGEFLTFNQPAAGNNSISGTPNGYFGINSRGTVIGLFPEQAQNDARFVNTAIANNGNTFDFALQGNGGAAAPQTFRSLTNEAGGTAIRMFAAEAGNDVRNFGYAQIIRSVNFNISDGLTGNSISGGRYFTVDTDNNFRKNIFGNNDLANKTYSGTLTSGSIAADEQIILGIINVNKGAKVRNSSSNPQGTDRSTDTTRTSDTVLTLGGNAVTANDQIIFFVTTDGTTVRTLITATAAQTAYTVASTSSSTIVVNQILRDDVVWTMDLRGDTNVPGQDQFSFVYWHPKYNITTFNNTSLTDGTTGTLILNANILEDALYSNTSTGLTELSDVDELYDYIKQAKSSSDVNILYPTLSTLAVSRSGTNLDIGSRDFAANTSGTVFTLDDDDVTVNVGTGNTLDGGTKFEGVTTTGDINLDNINLASTHITAANVTNFPTSVSTGTNITANTTLAIGTYTFSEGLTLNGTHTFSSGTTSLTFTGTSDLSNLDLIANSGATVTISGAVVGDFNSVVTNGTGTITFAGAILTVTPTADNSGNATFNGFFGVYNTTTDTVAQTTTAIVSGSAVPSFNITDASTYKVYVKRNSTTGGSGVGFGTGINSVVRGSINETRRFGPVSIADVLYESNPTPITSTVTYLTPANNQNIALDDSNSGVNVAFAGASTQQNGSTTLAALLQAANDEDYFRVVMENNLTGDIIVPAGVGSSTVNSQYVTITNASGEPIQLLQAITFSNSSEWLSVRTETVSAATVSVAINPSGISVGEVQLGVNNVLDTNSNISDLKKGVGYTVKQLDDLAIVDDYNSGSETGNNL